MLGGLIINKNIMSKKNVLIVVLGLLIVFGVVFFIGGGESLRWQYYLSKKVQIGDIPLNVVIEHQEIFNKIDEIILKEGIDNITSLQKEAVLSIYIKDIQLGVLPMLEKNDPLSDDVKLLLDELLKIKIDRKN